MSGRRAAAALLAAGLLAGCAQTRPVSTGSEPPRAGGASGSPAASASAPAGEVTQSQGAPVTCLDAARALPPAVQAGQVVLLGVAAAPDEATLRLIGQRHLGGVVLTGTFRTGVAGVAAVTRRLAEATSATPLLVAAAQEGGAAQPLTGPGFDAIPAAPAQAALQPADLRAKWAAWGRQLAAAGVRLDLAPVADVPAASGVAAAGALSADPTTAADAVATIVAGLQQGGVLAAAKHFPGQGAVTGNLAAGPASDATTAAGSASLLPFRAAAGSDADALVVSSATFAKIDPAHPAVFSQAVLRLAREDVRFGNTLVASDLAGKALSGVPAEQRLAAYVRAGGDVAIVGDAALLPAMVDRLVQEAADPAVAQRLTEAASNALALKARAGLVSCTAVKG